MVPDESEVIVSLKDREGQEREWSRFEILKP